ncbi:MAG: trypsin-like peptidase domain-containing protein [Patescibacteria group bacterium]|nr:trypsin-like peptidase domain-containing protein [Patescibacteria group bacterium]
MTHQENLYSKIHSKIRVTWLLVALMVIANGILGIAYLSYSAGSATRTFRSVEASVAVNDRAVTIREISDSQGGLRVEYDAAQWDYSEATSAAGSSHRFLMNNELGTATIDISPITATDTVLARRLFIESLSSDTRIASEATIQKWDRQVRVFSLTEPVLFERAPYTAYLVNAGQRFYSVLVRAPQLDRSRLYAERLLDGITFGAQVQGAKVTKPESDEVRTVALSRPSVVNILYLQCNVVEFATTEAKLRYLKKEYPYCFGGKGTGFILSPEGHIATNGHVVKIYPEQSLTDSLLVVPELEPFVADYLAELTFQKTSQESTPARLRQTLADLVQAPNALDSLYVSFYQSIKNGVMTIREGKPTYYVKMTDEPFVFRGERYTSSNSAQFVVATDGVREADLVGMDYADYFSLTNVIEKKKVDGSDVAILKLRDTKGMRFPALPLSEEAGTEGQPLLVIGYPALAEGKRNTESGFALLNYYTSSGAQTVTRGVISAIKQDVSGRRLIQTDASIERGNSGGPALFLNGTVAGVATYAFLSQSGNYNFLRGVEDLKRLMRKHEVSQGENEVYRAWKTGLEAFWEGKNATAAEQLAKVADAYPLHPTLRIYTLQLSGLPEEDFQDEEPAATTSALAVMQPSSGISQTAILITMGAITAFFLLLIGIQAVQIARLRAMVNRSFTMQQSSAAISMHERENPPGSPDSLTIIQ